MRNSSYKGFYGIMKGIVTRTDDPEEEKHNNRRRIQICVPSYHGSPFTDSSNTKLDESKTGKEGSSDLGIYPWAQVCSNMFNSISKSSDNNVSNGMVSGFISSIIATLFKTTSNIDASTNSSGIKSLDMLYPVVGDYVWVMFEGGDIRCPIYMGALSADITNQDTALQLQDNVVNTSTIETTSGDSLASIAYKMISSINNTNYTTLSNSSKYTKFGLLGWHKSDAKELFSSIRSAAPSVFTGYLTSNNAEKFETDVTSSGSWSSYKIQLKSNIATAVSSILGSNYGISYQNARASKDMTEVLEKGRSLHLTDPAALLFFCHTYYNGFQNAAIYGANKCDGSLDSIYEKVISSLSSYSSITKSYREKAYSYINNLINSKVITVTVSKNVDITTPRATSPASTSSSKSSATTSTVTPSTGGNTVQPVNYKQGNWGTNKAGKKNTWYNLVFGPSGRSSSDTYATSACSVTAMADVVYTWIDNSITPKTIGDLAISWGYRTKTSNGLTNWKEFYKKCAKYYGFNVSKVYTSSLSAYNGVYSAIKNGGNNTLAIIGVKGIYSNNGHFVVVWKVDGDTIYINDPGINSNSTNGKRREKATSANIKAAINSAMIFTKY